MSEHENEERIFRDGLEQVAEGADVSAPLAANARAAAARRRRGRVVMIVAAASVAAITVAGVVVSRDWSDGSAAPRVVDQPSESAEVTEWRTEYWHDMQVDVPAAWAFGASPSACAVGAVVGAYGEREGVEFRGTPYVGRPIYNSDLCPEPESPPTAPDVWMDPDIATGVVDVGGGYVQETVDVDGGRLAVATDDPELRRQILSSATGGETCTSDLERVPTVEGMLMEGMGDVQSAQVCAYRREGAPGTFDLVYATTLEQEQTGEFVIAVAPGNAANDPEHCIDALEYVVITVTGNSPMGGHVTQDYVVNVGCALIEVGPGDVRELTRDMVQPWVANGLPAILYGPTGGKGAMIDSFVGSQGDRAGS